jgi:hypothetical protein
VTTAPPALARCTAELACPWRWRTGPPRPCPLHSTDTADTLNGRMTAMGAVMQAQPGEQMAEDGTDGGDGGQVADSRRATRQTNRHGIVRR